VRATTHLLAMSGLLAAMLFAVRQAAVSRGGPGEGAAAGAMAGQHNRVQPLRIREELPAGAFLAAKAAGSAVLAQDDGAQPNQTDPATEIDRTVFEGVSDQTRSLTPRAYFHLLDVARNLTDAELDGQSQRGITFAHLATRPDNFRGQPVFLRGYVRRMTEIKPIANREGFDRLYEGWLFTDESQNHPYVIVFSQLPAGFPLGGDIVESVGFAGYFLKLWAYRSGDGDRYAPLLLGRSVTWRPRPPDTGTNLQTHGAMIAVVALLIGALVGVTWWSRRTAAALRETYVRPAPDDGPASVQTMHETVTPPAEDFLRDLEREAERS
jgi:hypothetical protein